MRDSRRYLAAGLSVVLGVALMSISSTSAGAEQRQRYSRYIDAGNTGAAIPVGKRTWEPQVGFTGGTPGSVEGVSSIGLPGPAVAKTVLTGPNGFALPLPNGRYRVSLWVLRPNGETVTIAAEGKERTTVRARQTSSNSRDGRPLELKTVTTKVRVRDGVLDLAFTPTNNALQIAALAIRGEAWGPTTSSTTQPPASTTTAPPITTVVPITTTAVPPTTVISPTTTARPTTTLRPTTTAPNSPPVNRACTNPVFKTSDTDGGWSTAGYYVHNNMWNASEGGPETLYACAHNNWYVDSTQPNTTAVKTYPNVHKDINNLNGAPLSNYRTITSTFAGSGPRVGIYNVAYDVWLNGVGWGNGTTEFMIWTENFNQRPLGSIKATVTFGGKTYDAWHYQGGGANVISLVAKSTMLSGNLNLKEMFDWAIARGWMPSNSTVNQIGYGVEICSTNNTKQRFTFTDFSITMN